MCYVLRVLVATKVLTEEHEQVGYRDNYHIDTVKQRSGYTRLGQVFGHDGIALSRGKMVNVLATPPVLSGDFF